MLIKISAPPKTEQLAGFAGTRMSQFSRYRSVGSTAAYYAFTS
jgi:hypothetical protein